MPLDRPADKAIASHRAPGIPPERPGVAWPIPSAESGAAHPKAERLASVDALRGLNIFWLLGTDVAMLQIAGMAEGRGPIIGGLGAFLGAQFTHAAWEGFRFYDFIFPLFIFVTGIAVVLSLRGLVVREGLPAAYARVARRALLLYALGLVYYGGISGHWSDVRLLGVLQRIAICYLFAALLFLSLDWRGLLAALVVLLGVYWALMSFVPVPGVGVGSFAPHANLADWIDANYLPGRLWEGTRDPEGILSTLPAIGSCLLGVLAGLLLTEAPATPLQKSAWLIAIGVVLVAIGHLWSVQFPVIKSIWTSSFVLVAGGYSFVVLGALHLLIDVLGIKAWATVFVWIGANAITLYFLNNVVGFADFAERLAGGDVARFFDEVVTPGFGGFMTRLVGIVVAIAIAGYFYRRRIFLRV